MKVLLFQTSSTQRVTATQNEDGGWLLSKEWRHNIQEPWMQGKGITIPSKYVQDISILMGAGIISESDPRFEFIDENEGDGKSDFNTTTYKKDTNYRTSYTDYRKQNPLGRTSQTIR